MKILIYGAETLGSVVASLLVQAGADVTVLVRGTHCNLTALEELDRQFR